MKTKEELNELKKQCDELSGKMRELTPEELEQVTGGVNTRGISTVILASLLFGPNVASEAGGAVNGIDPSGIKSLDILKDASATAIYGSRGAN